MTEGWIVVARRQRVANEREIWDCAIANPWAAERAVRRACEGTDFRFISAYTHLTPVEVDAIGLKNGEVRKRPISEMLE
jgi:hypothetical protein